MNAKIINQPKKIYLCLGDDETQEYDFDKLLDVTWSVDDATSVVIPYVLESEFITEQAKVKMLMKEIQEARRKFLDEVEKLKYEVVLGCDGLAKELGDDQPIIYGSDFSANLSKVIKGE